MGGNEKREKKQIHSAIKYQIHGFQAVEENWKQIPLKAWREQSTDKRTNEENRQFTKRRNMKENIPFHWK